MTLHGKQIFPPVLCTIIDTLIIPRLESAATNGVGPEPYREIFIVLGFLLLHAGSDG